MKSFFVLLFTLSTLVHGYGCALASAAPLGEVRDAEFQLNRAAPEGMRKYQLGTLVTSGTIMVAKATYDFAKLGGGLGTKTLLGSDGQPVVLPDKAVIVDCIIDVQTPGTTSNAATIALSTGQGAGDLKGATGAASYTGRVACVPVGTAATAVKLTADRTMTATIAGTGTVTAGKFNVIVQYILSD